MSMTPAPDAQFSIATVASQTFASIGRNFVTFFALALIATTPEGVFFWYFDRGADFQAGNAADVTTYIGTVFAIVIAMIGTNYLLQAAITQGTVSDLNGQRASLGNCLAAAIRAFLPLILISVLATLGILLGMILLIVPGIILAVGWSVIVPVRVVERTGIVETLGRSWDLTSGHRWAIFGLMLIFAIGSIGFQALGSAVEGAMGVFGRPEIAMPWPYLLYNIALSAVQSLVGAAGVGAVYYQLRVVKEGIGPEQLATVFE